MRIGADSVLLVTAPARIRVVRIAVACPVKVVVSIFKLPIQTHTSTLKRTAASP